MVGQIVLSVYNLARYSISRGFAGQRYREKIGNTGQLQMPAVLEVR